MKSLGYVIVLAAGLAAGYFLGRNADEATPRTTRTSSPAEDRLRDELATAHADAEAAQARYETMRKQNQGLAKALEKTLPPPPEEAAPEEAAPKGEPTDEEIKKTVREFRGVLQQVWFGKGGEKQVAALQEMLARSAVDNQGRNVLVTKLVEKFRAGDTGSEEATVLAHVLAQSGQPEAIEALKQVLRDPDSPAFKQRFAAHGLAFSPAEGLDETLEKTAREAKDIGTRANAAYGLARKGNQEGVALYAAATDEAFESKDPIALAYLSGFLLLGDKSFDAVAERLLKYKDAQAKLSLIEIARQTRNTHAIANLQKLANDTGQGKDIQNAARGALKQIREAAK